MKRFLVLILFTVTLFQFSTTYAAEVAVVSADAATGISCSGYVPKNGVYALRLKAGLTGNLTRIAINLSVADASDSIEIRRTDGIGTAGTLVATLSYSSNTPVSTYYNTSFIGSAAVTANSEYWVIFRGTTGNICYDVSTVTYANNFSLIMSSTYYVWANGSSTFNESNHWSMKIFSDAAPVDSTPPTFPSTETFTVAENQTSVGSIKSSESATMSIFGGLDQNKFSLAQTDSTTASLSFLAAPNYEIPLDVGADNNYQVVIRAIDPAGNKGYETVTATVTDVDENARLVSYTVSGAQTKGQITTLVATVNVPGKVTFLVNGKRIGGCIGKPTVGSGPITATCQWKSALRGNVALTFTIVPTAVNYFATTSQPSFLVMGRRVNTR